MFCVIHFLDVEVRLAGLFRFVSAAAGTAKDCCVDVFIVIRRFRFAWFPVSRVPAKTKRQT